MKTFTIEQFMTPLGSARLITDAQGCVKAFDWDDHAHRNERLLRRYHGPYQTRVVAIKSNARGKIEDYFQGDISALDTIAAMSEGTPFQRTVWGALRQIPVGQTLSYAQLAKMIDNPKAMRAVGLANGANPIGLIVPCHRVIGADKSLTGYGGGLWRKQWLLRHESAVFVEPQPLLI